MRISKLLASASATALLAGAALIGLPGTAQAQAPSVTVTPNENLKGGDEIDVVATGFPPSTSVAIGICQTGRVAGGPGDCAAAKDGGAVLEVSDASGQATATLVVPEGPSGNTVPPIYDCGPNDPCSVSVAAISGDGEAVTVDLNYAAAAAPADDPADEPADEPAAPVEGATTGGTADAIAETGPRETLIIGLVGLALFQLGLMFAVRAVRSVPRRIAS